MFTVDVKQQHNNNNININKQENKKQQQDTWRNKATLLCIAKPIWKIPLTVSLQIFLFLQQIIAAFSGRLSWIIWPILLRAVHAIFRRLKVYLVSEFVFNIERVFDKHAYIDEDITVTDIMPYF